MKFEKKYDDAELIAAYRKYGSTTAAAREIDASYETIRRALVKAGITRDGRKLNGIGSRSGGGSPRKITDEEIILESKTMTRAEIAEKHGMCISGIDRKLHRLKIKCVPEYRSRGTKRYQGGKYYQRIEAAGFNAVYDPDVTLKRVMRRDENICTICGLPVDASDKSGIKIGNKYPTIDHIIPISLGGSHTWDNVRLAHMICNSKKCANAAEVS